MGHLEMNESLRRGKRPYLGVDGVQYPHHGLSVTLPPTPDTPGFPAKQSICMEGSAADRVSSFMTLGQSGDFIGPGQKPKATDSSVPSCQNPFYLAQDPTTTCDAAIKQSDEDGSDTAPPKYKIILKRTILPRNFDDHLKHTLIKSHQAMRRARKIIKARRREEIKARRCNEVTVDESGYLASDESEEDF